MSKNQGTIYYSQHYHLLNMLFGKNDGSRYDILIDRNECEQLVSSINHSPLKKHEGKILLDRAAKDRILKLRYITLHSDRFSLDVFALGRV